ncbi:hypothetical protein C6P44_001021 [Monosporozyma unispora]|nr:hypothetical protein C6P44_001021 [Kazachstania unispora]
MDTQPSRNELQPCFNRLRNLLDTLNGHTKYVPLLDKQLQSLNVDLNKIYDLLDKLFLICQHRATGGDLSIKFNNSILQQNVVVTYLIDDFEKYDTTFSHLLDIMELNEYEPHFDLVIDLVESCNFAKNKLQPLLTNLKVCIDIILEYHEILNDNMKALDTIINENIDDLFRIQGVKYESPIRHMPSFTLKQLLNMLHQDTARSNNNSNNSSTEKLINSNVSKTNNLQLKLPKFSPMEEKLINKFMEIQNNLRPIETSLLDILPQRLQQFEKRHQTSNHKIDTHLLIDQLKDDYRRILKNFKFLNSEINCLRVDLVDKRWNIIFTNLNHELEFLLNEINKNYETLLKINGDVDDNKTNEIKQINGILPAFNIELKLKFQIEKNTKIVSRTFDVIYAASEFSLLDQRVASRTNELAEYWVNLRPKSDTLLISVGNKLKSQKPLQDTDIAVVDKPLQSNNQALNFLEPPPPILSSRRFSNNSMSSNGSDSESDVGNKTIEAIANDLRTFSLGSSILDNKTTGNQSNVSITKRNASDPLLKNSSLITVSPQRNTSPDNTTTTLKTGAKLLQKMHIKPIIVSASIAASTSTDIDDEYNPFFDSDTQIKIRPQTEPQSNATKKTLRRQNKRSLILSTIPSLRHEDSYDHELNDPIPDIVREPLVHTVSSSMTVLSSPLSVRPATNQDNKILPNNNIDRNIASNIGDTTADTVIINDSKEDEVDETNILDNKNIESETPLRYASRTSIDSINTPILEANEDEFNSAKIPTSLSSLSPSSTSSVIIKHQHSSVANTPQTVPTTSEHASFIHYSPASLNKLLKERITLNKSRPSLIPHLQKTVSKPNKPNPATIPSPTEIPKKYMARRIRTPTPMSQLLARKPVKSVVP